MIKLKVWRSRLQARRLSRHGHTRRQLQRQWREATGSDPSAQMLWSRNSVFRRRGALLRVMETFVPGMKALVPAPGPRVFHRRTGRFVFEGEPRSEGQHLKRLAAIATE